MSDDLKDFRRCLGHFATGITVVTCRVGDQPHGATVNAFVAVSLVPKLVLVSLDRRSKACEYLKGQPFAVTVLPHDAHDTAMHFAGRPQEQPRFTWEHSGAVPVVAGGVASFVCAPWAEYDGGDHVLFVGEVTTFRAAPETSPLLFYAGKFHDVGTPLAARAWAETLDSPESGVTWSLPSQFQSHLKGEPSQ